MTTERPGFIQRAQTAAWKTLEFGSLVIPVFAACYILDVGFDGMFQHFEVPEIGPIKDPDNWNLKGLVQTIETVNTWDTADFIYAAYVGAGVYVAGDLAASAFWSMWSKRSGTK